MATLLFLLAAGLLPLATPPAVAATCVLDSDFGFVLNCGFRKSGLFRVRNLGGVKGYVGVGFSVGDELRFNESLSNVEPSSRRRSASARSSGAGPASDGSDVTGAAAASSSLKNDRRRPQLLRQLTPTVPPFKPIPRASTPTPTPAAAPIVAVVAPGGPGGALRVVAPPSTSSAAVSRPSRLAPAPPPMPPPPPPPAAARVATVPPFVTLPPTPLQKAGYPAAPVVHTAASSRHPAPPVAFRHALNAATHHFQVRKDVLVDPDVASNLLTSGGVHAVLPTVPPRSPPRRAAVVPTVVPNPATSTPASAPALPIAASAASLVAAATAPAAANITVAEAVALATAIQRLAHAANVSAEALAAALAARRQQNIAALATGATEQDMMGAVPVAMAAAPAAAAATVPPPPSTTRHPLASISKVMNAPREYYPVGYDKNFDDNFASRVELPDTPFHCGEQKHFPGLYADEDLGCMVFHVCALTDHGLIMKSFLCPESTLFDQTILKCNWWFYVDCKASKKLYDSNIPISKSYQLMKALAFFSAYNKS